MGLEVWEVARVEYKGIRATYQVFKDKIRINLQILFQTLLQ
jgi:hypothetical protein